MYIDVLASEYGWQKRYIVWDLQFAAGLKLITAAASRRSGRDILAERAQERLLTRLATIQEDIKNVKKG